MNKYARSRTWRQLMVHTLLACLLWSHHAVAQDAGGEVKALFLYNFANFVRWPEQAFTHTPDALRMCIFGDAPLGTFLDQVNGSKIRDKRLQVIRTQALTNIESGCQILFVSTDKSNLLPQLISSKKNIYVLSVSDVENFARSGGVVSIIRTSDKLTFEINLDTAVRNGLLISSDLLSMARIVGRDGKSVGTDKIGPDDTLLRDKP
jgi:hypothetical protein